MTKLSDSQKIAKSEIKSHFNIWYRIDFKRKFFPKIKVKNI